MLLKGGSPIKLFKLTIKHDKLYLLYSQLLNKILQLNYTAIEFLLDYLQ